MIYWCIVISHAVEGACSSRIRFVRTIVAVSSSTRNSPFIGLQPSIELKLTCKRCSPVLASCRGIRNQSAFRIGKSICCHHVLVALMSVACSDTPCPVTSSSKSAAPSSIPSHQVVAGVFASTCGWTSVCSTSDLLEVLVVHSVTQIVAHFFSFFQISLVVISK
ncbi:hypothetical protein D3C81_1378160 [compost metagenome]